MSLYSKNIDEFKNEKHPEIIFKAPVTVSALKKAQAIVTLKMLIIL